METEERKAFLEEMGLCEIARDRLLRMCYRTLNLISFLTVVSNELRAWTVPAGCHALDAAGVIHSDMQRGFIRAEVVGFDTLSEAGSMKQAKEKNLVRLEGKHYELADGDVIFFRFHV